MEYNSYTIGKVRTFDNYFGEIIAQDGVYMFISEDISPTEVIEVNDMVLFRAEEINNVKKAFFIKKLNKNLNIEDEVIRKVKKLELSQENE